MITLGDVFRRYGPAYRARWGSQLSSAQLAAMHAIEACRTEALGGQVYRCPHCDQVRYAYHSCRNRHCPTCQHDAAQDWLARQQDLLLPVPSFLVTFTLPAALRAIAFQHQAQVYDLFFRASAAALQQLAQDPRFLGGQLGMVGVLQTWTRDLRYHPHIHYLVPGGGLSADGRTWITARADFLVHVKPLAILFRAKLQAALRQTELWRSIPAEVWRQAWVVDCRPVGSGWTALKYLAPYVFRVALSNNRILGMADGEVTFRYQDGETRQTRISTLSAEAFIERFLQHILPKGFVKVRSYGLFRVGARQQLTRLRAQLILQQRKVELLPPDDERPEPDQHQDLRCPNCGQALRLERVLPRQRAPPDVQSVASREQRR
ncbi:IS91 family transposase [Candidatus Chloroploca asiatica]|uniref:IS91 family transposase n=1 Tax=Candidatus Chloroploca asiatica TaxID=1506545 RepID=UPI000BE8CBB3|nr:IS91 family transposase [Candidatus Chloroploca asiatica]